MKRIQISKNFYLDEYIPKELYLQFEGREHILIGLLDQRLIESDQKLRDLFGPVTINNWWYYLNKDIRDYRPDEIRNWSGLRTPDSPYYSRTSQHSFGRASDKIFKLEPASAVLEGIKLHWKQFGITSIEEGVQWVHSDVRYIPNQSELLIFGS